MPHRSKFGKPREMEVLTLEEVKRILSVAGKYRYGEAIVLLMLTDFENNLLHVERMSNP